jgi:hypothetical protein
VDVLAHLRRLGHGGDDALGEVVRVRAGEPHAPDPLHRPDRAQEVGEVVRAIGVAVDRLAQERDFGDA